MTLKKSSKKDTIIGISLTISLLLLSFVSNSHKTETHKSKSLTTVNQSHIDMQNAIKEFGNEVGTDSLYIPHFDN